MWKSIRSLFPVCHSLDGLSSGCGRASGCHSFPCVILLIDLVVDVEEHQVVTLSRMILLIDLVADVEEHQDVTPSRV